MNTIFSNEFEALLAGVVNELPLPTGDAGWGSDLSCADDLDENFAELAPNDPQVVAQYTYRRMITNPGECADDPDWGCGLPRMLSSGYTEKQIKTIEDALRGEIARDDRLQDVIVSADYSYATEALNITVDATIVDSNVRFSLTTVSASGATNLIEMVVNGSTGTDA